MKTFSSLTLVVVLLSSVLSPFIASAQDLPGLDQLPAIQTTITGANSILNQIPTVPTNDLKQNAVNTGIVIPFININIGISWNQLALDVSKIVVNQIVDSTVRWFQSGFPDGGPAYVADPKSYFGSLANGVVGDELGKLSNGVLCSPFQAKITLAIRQATVGGDYSPQCTLTGIVKNYDNFINNFQEGGWDAFFAITQNTANNPYGAFADAQLTINNKVEAEVNSATQEIAWGSGFKSEKSCLQYNVTKEVALKYLNDNPNGSTLPPGYDPKYDFGACIRYGDVMTPGSTLKSHLDVALPANTFLGQVVSADSFSKLLTALGNGLIQRFVTGKNGLLGKSSNGSSNPGGGSNTVPTISCSANVTRATVNEDTVTWSVGGIGGQTASSIIWSGDEGLTGSSTFVSTVYTTPGTKSAIVTASTTNLDNLGAFITGTHKSSTVTCTNNVTVSPYHPLSVSCSPSVSHIAPNIPVKWIATITGGSGTFERIQWDGQQGTVPKASGDAARMWPQNNTTAPHITWSWFGDGNTGVTTEDNTTTFTAAGTTTTSIVTRVYLRDKTHIGSADGKITVIDRDTTVQPVTNQACNGSIFIDD
ncbi:MAG: hypothetical protein JWN50_829 [Parcubacteria group bacterium]|nr:hypothetical protein [Parcubacteria group bacterium]